MYLKPLFTAPMMNDMNNFIKEMIKIRLYCFTLFNPQVRYLTCLNAQFCCEQFTAKRRQKFVKNNVDFQFPVIKDYKIIFQFLRITFRSAQIDKFSL